MENIFHQHSSSKTVNEEVQSKELEEIIKLDTIENQPDQNGEGSLLYELANPRLSNAKLEELRESFIKELELDESYGPEFYSDQLNTKWSPVDLQNRQEWLLNVVKKLCEWPAEEITVNERVYESDSEDDEYSSDEMEDLEDSKFERKTFPVSEDYQELEEEDLGKARVWENYKELKENAEDWQEVMEDDLKKFMGFMEEINIDYEQHFQNLMEKWNCSMKSYQTWGDE